MARPQSCSWIAGLADIFSEPYLSRYREGISQHCLDAETLGALTFDQLGELGVAMGHRQKLLTFARSQRSEGTADVLALSSSAGYLATSSTWEDLADVFNSALAEEYESAIRHHCLDPAQVTRLNDDGLRELGIRIGHREKLLEVAESLELMKKSRVKMRRNSEKLRRSFAEKSVIVHSIKVSGGLEWVDCNGSSPNYEQFLKEMQYIVTTYGFPDEFGRLFLNKGPMPFVDIKGRGAMVGLLLRLPDLTGVEGSSMTMITNRLVVLISLSDNLVVTYHKNEIETLHALRRDLPKEPQLGMGMLLESILKEAMRSYDAAITCLREHMDSINSHNTDEVMAVLILTSVREKANVFKRCVTGSSSALEETAALKTFADVSSHIRAVCDRLHTIESVCDEVQGNALASVDLNIAMSEFRSSRNLKIFTYLTILTQPISVATSWYGMNWTSMSELNSAYGYQIFAPVIWLVATSILAYILYREWRTIVACRKARQSGLAKVYDPQNLLVTKTISWPMQTTARLESPRNVDDVALLPTT